MGKDVKILLGSLVFTFLLIVGLSFLLSGEGKVLEEVKGIEANPASYEVGDIPIDGGILTKEFTIKNSTNEKLTLRKIATSCMCTEAKVLLGGAETTFYGMEHATDKNPPVNLDFAPGSEAAVIVNFDPAAHGPEGVGPFERDVWLTFSDPAGIKTLSFSGRVTSE